MQQLNTIPSINNIINGEVIFGDAMPVWLGNFGDDTWPFVEPASPLFNGESTSSIIWNNYLIDKEHWKKKYKFCLTPEIIYDLKVAAVIHGFFPKLIKNARSTKTQLDPKTVKGRIDELAKFFSSAINLGKEKYGIYISRLNQISFQLLKEVISIYPGRGAHLKRALLLISDPMVQKNLSAPLQWQFLDIQKSSISWPVTADEIGIPALSDSQFLFLLNYCKRAIAKFKKTYGMEIHDSECRALQVFDNESIDKNYKSALDCYYREKSDSNLKNELIKKFGITASEITESIRDAHTSSLLIILLLTGMRSTETRFLMSDCLTVENGYRFIKSKVVKARPKDAPVSEGWLVIDLTQDAYDILSFFSSKNKNKYLFSTPFPGFVREGVGYKGGALNTKFSRWIKRIDTDGLFDGWTFSIHQCRETLVFQLAKQQVGMPFISMQLKHFQSQFNNMPNSVTAGYGQYRSQLMKSVTSRLAEARESALLDVYGEDAKFAGGGGEAHKVRIDTFFAGLGLFGEGRQRYIKDMARRGVKLMPTSIGSCTKNFIDSSTENSPPPCYGDFQCDPDCANHVITDRCGQALMARKEHAISEADRESNLDRKIIWLGLAQKLNGHLVKLENF